MNIQTLEYAGFNSAFRALRLSYGKTARSYMFFGSTVLGAEWGINIHPKDLALVQALIRKGDDHAKVIRGIQVWAEITAPIYWWCELETYGIGRTRLMSSSTMHIDCKDLKGDELVKIKSEMPMGKELTKIDCFSYQTLRRIYYQRKNHRLPEWKQFLDWIETLPYANELILIPYNNEQTGKKNNAPEQ